MDAKICATEMITAAFAISEGWNLIPKIGSQRAASFSATPNIYTAISKKKENGSMNTGSILNQRHGIR
jgi:hypothetical protein